MLERFETDSALPSCSRLNRVGPESAKTRALGQIVSQNSSIQRRLDRVNSDSAESLNPGGWWLGDCEYSRFDEYTESEELKLIVLEFITSNIIDKKLNGYNYLQWRNIVEINLTNRGKMSHLYTYPPSSRTDE